MLSSSDGSCSLDASSEPSSGGLTMLAEVDDRHFIANSRSTLLYRLVSDEEDIHPQVKTDQPIQMTQEDLENVKHLLRYVDTDGRGHITKLWQCAVCFKTFKQQYTLQRHLPTHTDQRDFKCTDCGKAFRQLSTLSQHRSIHSTARPYVCPVCLKTFNRVSSLISHKKTHLAQKTFTCQTCGKGFHQKGNLRNHEFTHTNKRPYICNLCGRGFNQRSNLICHQNHAHNEGPPKYCCSVCGSKFRMASALRQHQASVHDIKHPTSTRVAGGEDGDVFSAEGEDRGSGAGRLAVRTYKRPPILGSGRQLQASVTPAFDSLDLEQITIEPISNPALSRAKARGQTPFALYKPLNGPSMLVKISDTVDNKQSLSAADANDIMAAAGTKKVSSSPGKRFQHIQVPVVATFVQRHDDNGEVALFVESAPSSRQQEQQEEPPPVEPPVIDIETEYTPYARRNNRELYEMLSDDSLLEGGGHYSGPNVVVRSVDEYRAPYVMVNGEEEAEEEEDVARVDVDETVDLVAILTDGRPERRFVPTSMKIQRSRGERGRKPPATARDKPPAPARTGIDDLLEFAANTGGVLLARENKDGSFHFTTQEEKGGETPAGVPAKENKTRDKSREGEGDAVDQPPTEDRYE